MNIKGLFIIALVTLVGIVNGESAVQEADAVARELQVVNFSSKLTNAVNAKRAQKGLKDVCINTKLTKAAQVLANDMARNNFVNTRGSDGSTPTMRYKAQGLTSSKSAELVAAGYTSVDAVVAAWIKSAGAYLYSDLKFIGTGYRYDSTKQYKHYWVVDMANANGEHLSVWLTLIPLCKKTTSLASSRWLTSARSCKRAQKGLKAVCINSKLAKAAQVLAADNAKNNKVTTKGFDVYTPAMRYSAQKIKATQSAELVAAGQASVDAVIATWIKSSSAYLYSDFKFIGPGYSYDKTKTYKHYWVLDFANANGES